MDHAACGRTRTRGGEDDPFFPTQGKRALLNEGRRICAACPVQRECNDYATDNRERFGLWAGKFYDGGRWHRVKPDS